MISLKFFLSKRNKNFKTFLEENQINSQEELNLVLSQQTLNYDLDLDRKTLFLITEDKVFEEDLIEEEAQIEEQPKIKKTRKHN